jgi:hypothetical protein
MRQHPSRPLPGDRDHVGHHGDGDLGDGRPTAMGDESSNQTAHGYGHHFETYEKAGGRWYITETKLRRLRVDVTKT